jgi:TldD protein
MFNPDRRQLLQGLGAGVSLLTMPSFLAGCARAGAPVASAVAPLPANPFLTWFDLDEAMLREVLAVLGSRGATFADVYLQHARYNTITMEDGIVSAASSSIDQGAGLRVVIGDQTGFAFTEDLSRESLLAAARTAAGIAAGAPVAAPAGFRTAAEGGLYKLAVPWSEVGITEKLPRLQYVEAKARAADPAVEKVTVTWVDGEERVLIATLGGLIATDFRPMTRLFVNVTANKAGVRQSNNANLAGRQGFSWYTDEKLDGLAKQAVDRTMVLFEARRPPAGELPVILAAGASGILLHEAVGHGLEADFNRKKVSIYADRIGERVAPDFVTVVDSATEPFERGALNVDDEGNPGKRTVLIEDGVLRSYLHDSISAKHYGVEPTGSGRRESFRFPPMPRMSCTFMEGGPHSKEEMIASVQRGIIAETFTNGQVNIGAGDFTFYIKGGWLIEGGKITAPIKDCNIIGNGPEVLQRLSMAANDAQLDTGGWTCGKNGQGVPVSQGLPTVLVSRMTVGGEDA